MKDELPDNQPTAETRNATPLPRHPSLIPVARLVAPPPPFHMAASPLAAAMLKPCPRPWGLWTTLGWSLLGLLLELIVTLVLILIAGVVAGLTGSAAMNSAESLKAFTMSGLFVSVSSVVMLPVGFAYLVLITHLRGWRPAEYLALNRSTARQTVFWLAVMAAYMVISDTVTILLGRDVVPPFMVDVCKTAGFMPLLVLAVVLVAPLFEEVVFRGFMYRGIAASRLGPAGAISIATILWSLLHVQYDSYGIAYILVCGVLLGLARYGTGSVVPPILMHMLNNAGATAQALVKLADSA